VLAFLASALTHPVVFFAFPYLEVDAYWVMVAYAEAFAVSVEAVFLTLLSVPYSIIWALVANGLSLAVGLVLRHWLSWP